ncbi:MAG: PIN domain-containing protein [Cyclobacteriaceae bacterium]|nr:PIN domain-containing protein [Cyclobacteriaceae bacterium]
MILADTSIWITYFRNSDADLKDVFDAYLKKNDVYTVSAVFGELFQGAKNNRDREMIQGFWENMPKAKEDNLFIEAGLNSNKYKLLNQGVGLVDSCILAACLENNLALWTLDKKLQRAYDLISK